MEVDLHVRCEALGLGSHSILEALLQHYRAPPEIDIGTSHSVRVFENRDEEMKLETHNGEY
jgi:hypothetical protein